MAKFKVGDKVQLSVETVEYLEAEGCDKIQFWEWQYVYTGQLTIKYVYTEFDPTHYVLEEIGVGFYEFELERD